MLNFSTISENISQVFGDGAPERLNNVISQERNILSSIINSINSYGTTYEMFKTTKVNPSTGEVTDTTDSDASLKSMTDINLRDAQRTINLAYKTLKDQVSTFSSMLERRQSFVGDVYFTFDRGAGPLSCQFLSDNDFKDGQIAIVPKHSSTYRSGDMCLMPIYAAINTKSLSSANFYKGQPTVLRWFGAKVMQCTIVDGVRGKRWVVVANIAYEGATVAHIRTNIYCITNQGTQCAYTQCKVSSFKYPKEIRLCLDNMGLLIDVNNLHNLSDTMTDCPIQSVFIYKDELDLLGRGLITPTTYIWNANGDMPTGGLVPEMEILLTADSMNSVLGKSGINNAEGACISGYLQSHTPVDVFLQTTLFGTTENYYTSAGHQNGLSHVGQFVRLPLFSGMPAELTTYTPYSLTDDITVVSAEQFRDVVLPREFTELVENFLSI